MPVPHIEETQIDQYAMGILSGNLLAEVEEHLLFCAACQSRLVETDEFLSAFRLAATQVAPRPVPVWTRILNPRALWAGFPVLVVLVTLIAIVPRTSTVPSVVQMQSLRGPESGAQVRAGRPLVLVFDADAFTLPESTSDASSPGYQIKVLDLTGSEVLVADAGERDGKISVPVQHLGRGSYWVRLYRKGSSTLAAEYSLRAE
jgi:hypothetical protein